MNPIDDVNRSQSTNDVYPTAAKISIALALRDFLGEHEALRESFAAKGHEFHDVLKVGRTQLQDAVPMTLGQEFHGFATTLGEDEDRIREVLPLLREINLGATAIGTGITADPRYPSTVRRHLSELLGEEYITARDLVEATSDTGVFMQMSGRAEAGGREAAQDLQRPPAAVLRPAGRASARSCCRPARRARRSCRAR